MKLRNKPTYGGLSSAIRIAEQKIRPINQLNFWFLTLIFLFLLQTKWKISFYQAKKPKATIFQLSLCFRSRGSEWWGWQQQQWQQQARAKQLLKWIQGQTHFSTSSYWFSLQPMLKSSFFHPALIYQLTTGGHFLTIVYSQLLLALCHSLKFSLFFTFYFLYLFKLF